LRIAAGWRLPGKRKSSQDGRGGISLWDVTDPADPEPLYENLDKGEFLEELDFEFSYHSTFAWTMDDRAFVVGSNNEDLWDVDIFEITDPSNPEFVSEAGQLDWDDLEITGFGEAVFNHDMIVEQVGDQWLMLVSYWDAGHLILDVTDPAEPEFLRQTLFDETEPFADELGLPDDFRPEGNAHQARFTFDNQFFFATDEFFNPFRLDDAGGWIGMLLIGMLLIWSPSFRHVN
jgi:hypothetical protein